MDNCMYFRLFLYLSKVILVTYPNSLGLRERCLEDSLAYSQFEWNKEINRRLRFHIPVTKRLGTRKIVA
jgi:hypothetical protein